MSGASARVEPAATATLVLAGTMRSHPGSVRSGNEDRVLHVRLDPADAPAAAADRRAPAALALVADGMGGHAAGEVASRIAAAEIERIFRTSEAPPPVLLARAFAAANEAIWREAEADPACRGMGTTCTAVIFTGGRLYLAHVGDSRAYLWRDGALYPLSEDDSLVHELVRAGEISREEAQRRPDRHVILRALGTRPEVVPAIWSEGLALAENDRLILCSDGLTDLVDDGEIARIAGLSRPADAADRLIEAALAAGGLDNVSVGVFRIGTPLPDGNGAAGGGGEEDRPTRPSRVPLAGAEEPASR